MKRMDPLRGELGSKLVSLAAMALMVACVSGSRLISAKPSELARSKTRHAFTKVAGTAVAPAFIGLSGAK